MNIDWESLAKRMIAANQIGIRIEQSDGHRWIITNPGADFWRPIFNNTEQILKEYSSYSAALDRIDAELTAQNQRSLIEIFKDINYYDDLGLVFGEGTQ